MLVNYNKAIPDENVQSVILDEDVNESFAFPFQKFQVGCLSSVHILGAWTLGKVCQESHPSMCYRQDPNPVSGR